jgi:Na+/H+ antiporter NhaC
MQDHPYGWLSLLPPLVAIALAMLTRKVLLSLTVGVFVGSAVVTNWNPVETLVVGVRDHLWPALINPDKLHVFAFTMLLGAMIGVVNRSGGMQGLVDLVAPLAKTRRRGQLTVWFLGLFVFFDDYANTLLLGKTLQPLTDRLKISREKLAYLVDSTAAPVAGLALISTWVAIEIDYINLGLEQLANETNVKASTLFLASIPYRFYVWGALLLVPIIALSGRDFGPMRKAERQALAGTHDTSDAGSEILASDPTLPEPNTPARWFNAVIPVVVTVVAVIYFLYQSGVDPEAKSQTLQEIIGNADSYTALLWGALTGLVTAVLLVLIQWNLLPAHEVGTAAWNGALKMTPALAILWLAGAISGITGDDANANDSERETQQALLAKEGQTWSQWYIEQHQPLEWNEAATASLVQQLQQRDVPADQLTELLIQAGASPDVVMASLTDAEPLAGQGDAYPYRDYRLYTGRYLNDALGKSLPAWIIPTVVFCLAGFIAFSTGTSWGTMALVMPLSIPLAVGAMDQGFDPNSSLLLCVIGSVLAGAIFGDHCSPISDTTVLSSQSSGCDHIAHVNTQMPYALSIAALAILFGTLPVGLGLSWWICLPLQILGAGILVFTLGQKTDECP